MKQYVRIDIDNNAWDSGSTYTTTANLGIIYNKNYGVAISKITIKIAHTSTNYSNSETGNQIRIFHKISKPVGNLPADIFFKGIISKRTIIDNIINIEADDYLIKTQDKIGEENYEDSSGTNIKTIIQELCTLSGLTYDMSGITSTPETILKFDTINQQCFGRISYLLGLINWYWYFDPELDDAVFRPRSALSLQEFGFASSECDTNITALPEWIDDSGDVVNDMIAVGGASETTIENEPHTYGETPGHTSWTNGDMYELDEPYEDMTIISVQIESDPVLNPEDYSTINQQSPDGTRLYFPTTTMPTPGESFIVSYLFNKKSKLQTANNSTSITQYGEKEKVINDRKVVDAGDLSSLVTNLVGDLFWGKATKEVRIKVNESSIVPILGSKAAVYDGIRNKSLVWSTGVTECIVMAVSSSWPGAGGDTTTISTKSMKDPYQSSHIEDRYDGLAREVSEINPTELYKLTGEKALSGTMDCGHNQLINFRVHNVATTGLLGYEADGQLQFNTVDDKLYCYDGSTWVDIMGSSAGITDHGTLTGLGDDDHSQYLLTNGNRACTGTFYINNTLPELHFEKSAVTKGTMYVDASDNFIVAGEDAKLILGTIDASAGVVEIDPKNQGVVATFDSNIINYSVPFNMNYHKIGLLATPTSDYDASTKKYVDDNLGIIDHGTLNGLGDNDHTQYLLRTGGSACQMSGDLQINRTEPGIALYEGSSLRGSMYIDASNNFIIASEDDKLILGTWTGAGVIEIEPKNAGVVATFDSSVINYSVPFNMNYNKIGTLATPTSDYDAATKKYVDDNLEIMDHGDLNGLGDNDHTQYLLRTGGSACQMSGDLQINRNEPGIALYEGSSLRGSMYVDASNNFIIASEDDKLILGTWTGAGVIEIEPKNDGVVASFDSTVINYSVPSNMNYNRIRTVGTPTSDYDAATKKYVDDNSGDHGALTGLGDNDHTQYLLRSGGSGCQMTGDLQINRTEPGIALYEGSGLRGSMYIDSSNNFIIASEIEKLVLGTWSGAGVVEIEPKNAGVVATFDSTVVDYSVPITIDFINERTLNAGVTIEGLGIEDSNLKMGGSGIYQDVTNANAGLLLNRYSYNGGTTQYRDINIYNGKNSLFALFNGLNRSLKINTITELSSSAGVTIEGLCVEDSYLAIKGSNIWQDYSATDSAACGVNYNGYQDGNTYFRDFNVYNGKQTKIIFVDGSANEINFYGDLDMDDNDIIGCNIVKATTSQDLTFQITSGRAIIWQTV